MKTKHNKYQLSLMNPSNSLHHGERAANKSGRQCDNLATKLSCNCRRF